MIRGFLFSVNLGEFLLRKSSLSALLNLHSLRLFRAKDTLMVALEFETILLAIEANRGYKRDIVCTVHWHAFNVDFLHLQAEVAKLAEVLGLVVLLRFSGTLLTEKWASVAVFVHAVEGVL